MVSIADHTKYYQLYLSQGLGMGIGAGLIYVPAMAVQGHHWRAHRARRQAHDMPYGVFPFFLHGESSHAAADSFCVLQFRMALWLGAPAARAGIT